MAALVNLARMTVTGAPGAGDVTLNAAADGYLSFAAAGVLDSVAYTYGIKSGSNREVGEGHATGGGTIWHRDKILSSTNGGAAINAGTDAVVSIVAVKESFNLLAQMLAVAG